MSVDRAQLKVQLRNLREWRKEYYNGTPLVPDAVYDDVEDQIRAALSELTDGEDLKKEIETFLAEVGAAVPAGTASAPAHWVKVKHKAPAGSLNKAQTADEFADWLTTCRKLIGLPSTRLLPGTRVKTVAVPNPSTDWDPAVLSLRRFGVDGIVLKHSDSHGLCYEVEHTDDKTKAWYEPRELDGPGVIRGVWSEKMDGISILLYYEGGHLKQAVTRGDGIEGEDITRNVLKMKGVVPFVAGFDGDIRGEIVLTKSDHKAHFPTYANPRNAAAGLAKRIDGHGSEHLTVFHYRLRRQGGKPITSKTIEFRVLERLKVRQPNWGTYTTVDEANAVYNRYVNGQRAMLDYDIDGLVFEHDAESHMDTLGDLNNRPRGAVAYKFPHDQKVTTIQDIQWQVGNTGRITPVAIFDPVSLAGATVTNASLHTVTRVERLKLFKGCSIVVSRRNDVIPMVEANLDEGIWLKDID